MTVMPRDRLHSTQITCSKHLAKVGALHTPCCIDEGDKCYRDVSDMSFGLLWAMLGCVLLGYT